MSAAERRRGRGLRALLWAVAGLAALALLAEGALRLFAPGYSSHYLVSGQNADGTPVWMDNAFFSYRFFPRRTAPLPLPVRVPRERASGTLRVVVLGDTDFLGEPDPSFGVGRILEPLLQAKMPDRRVEVLSLGIRSGNSHVMREIARDLPRLKPDAVVLFEPHREVAHPAEPHPVAPDAGFVVVGPRARPRGHPRLARRGAPHAARPPRP